MAETFKNARLVVTTSMADVYVCPAGTTAIVLFNQVANITSTVDALVTCQYLDASAGNAAIRFCYATPVPLQAAFVPISGKHVLEAGDRIQIQADANSRLEFTLSVLEIS